MRGRELNLVPKLNPVLSTTWDVQLANHVSSLPPFGGGKVIRCHQVRVQSNNDMFNVPIPLLGIGIILLSFNTIGFQSGWDFTSHDAST